MQRPLEKYPRMDRHPTELRTRCDISRKGRSKLSPEKLPYPVAHAGRLAHPRTNNAHPTRSQAPRYDRERDLPRLIRLWPDEVASRAPAVLELIVRKLRAALRAERQRGLAGHWTYDLARHSQLHAAYRAELHSLNAIRSQHEAVASRNCGVHECYEIKLSNSAE